MGADKGIVGNSVTTDFCTVFGKHNPFLRMSVLPITSQPIDSRVARSNWTSNHVDEADHRPLPVNPPLPMNHRGKGAAYGPSCNAFISATNPRSSESQRRKLLSDASAIRAAAMSMCACVTLASSNSKAFQRTTVVPVGRRICDNPLSSESRLGEDRGVVHESPKVIESEIAPGA